MISTSVSNPNFNPNDVREEVTISRYPVLSLVTTYAESIYRNMGLTRVSFETINRLYASTNEVRHYSSRCV
jgi:hypothetical protein